MISTRPQHCSDDIKERLQIKMDDQIRHAYRVCWGNLVENTH
jgi:hypothetical protein